MQVLNELFQLPNVQIRNYDGLDVWGVSKDFEEIILGAVSGNDVAGIGSILDEHIKNLNPVLEECWMKGRAVKSIADAQEISAVQKREPKPVQVATKKAAVENRDTGQIMHEKAMSTPKLVANPEMASDIKDKYNTIREGLSKLSKEYIAKALEELREYIVNKYGFNRLVFEISKKARMIAKKPEDYMTPEEITELNADVDSWLQNI